MIGSFFSNNYEDLCHFPIISDITNVNTIYKIENLPKSLKHFDCSWNKIKIIENLPETLENFNCHNNFITKLENLPNSIRYFDCSDNFISKIENLSNELIYMDIHHNRIFELENFPTSIAYLDCSANFISDLSNLPKSLFKLDIRHNGICYYLFQLFLKEIKIQNPKLDIIYVDGFVDYEKSKVLVKNITEQNGIFCVEKTETKMAEEDEKELKEIFKKLKNIYEIIKLNDIPNKERFYSSKNFVSLINLIPSLKKLANMVGLKDIKEEIYGHICCHLKGLIEKDLMNVVIYGSSGVGKSEVGMILSEIYLKLGFLKSNKIVFAKRSDLIGGYLGQTATKTQSVIDSALGGVLFLDEVYSLGNSSEHQDIYSKECIDTINRNLTEHVGEFICIIAGYEKEINECFFRVNKGLERRFPIRFTITGYTPKEMVEIFKLKIKQWENKVSDEFMEKFFGENKESFKFYGGDIEIFISNIKYVISKRLFTEDLNDKVILEEDINKSFEVFSKKKKQEDDFINTLYI
jgi:hypothetical protein